MINEPARCEPPATYFAPAGRDTAEEFRRKQEVVRSSPLLTAALDAIPGMVMLLNTNRQIVAANRAMLRVLEVSGEAIWEKRPGEVVGCVRPPEGPDGCGTSRHCVTCGAVDAILQSQARGTQVLRECRIVTRGESTALDLRVAATPIVVDGEHFVVVAVEDISQPKRLAVLERVFFHDVLNTAGCISGYADHLTRQQEAVAEVAELLTHLSEQLIEEIHAQRDLVLAESGDLRLQVDMLTVPQILEDLRRQYLKNPVAARREIKLGQIWKGVIWTDRRLLMRVLGNMLKNGLEATPPGETVTLECLEQEREARFTVHNPALMPEQIQLQIFQRSFSTKGQAGRGVGTYSMKLLGERYLQGRVEFTSRDPEGTTFGLAIPKKLPGEQQNARE